MRRTSDRRRPLLQRWRSDGSKVNEIVDFGLSYPLPALDIVAA